MSKKAAGNRKLRELIESGKSDPALNAIFELTALKQGSQPILVNMDGSPIMTTPEILSQQIERYVPTVSPSSLERYRSYINAAQREYRRKYGQPGHSDLERVRRGISRELQKRKETAGTAPTPNTLLRNSHYTKQLLLEWDRVIDLDADKTVDGVELASQHKDILSTRPAGYIIDAISSYVRDYFDNGPSDNMSLTAEKDYYVIRDDFDSFCRRAAIEGTDRRKVKESLFPEPGKAGLLERVKFIIPRDGKRYTMTIRFVSARRVLVEEHKRSQTIQQEGSSVVAFEMDVHARLFEFLEHREDIRGGRGRGSLREGFQKIPLALNAKTDRALSLMSDHLSLVDPRWTPVKRNTERFRKAVLYLIDRWNTGSQNRQQDMVVPWADLKDRGILPAHSHSSRKHKRNEDMVALYHLTRYLHREHEAFSGCADIELDQRGALIFRIEEPGRRPQIGQ